MQAPTRARFLSVLLAASAASLALFPLAVSATRANAQGQGAATSAAAPPSVRQAKAVFVYVADRSLKSVCVAGTFNGWNKDASPLRVDADGRTWRRTLNLPYGKQEYKFVLDGATWVADPTAKTVDDGEGHTNSVLRLLPADYARPARPDDGVIAASALRHAPADVSYRNYDRGALTLALRARPGDLRGVTLIVGGKRIAMQASAVGGGSRVSGADGELYTRWVARVPWERGKGGDLAYTFALADGSRVARYDANGLATMPGKVAIPFTLRAKTFQPFVVPAWVEKSVIYQIFPDRFADGDTRNDPPNVVPWNAAPTGSSRFGGDAAGVRAHLDYLSDLGVSAVYFNPVFASPSNHRYDATDYKRVDGQFGTNAEFADLTRAMNRRGIRTVLDFAFNHTATDFKEFADVREKGAASPYKDWYFIHSYPVRVEEHPNYEAWWGYPSLPKLNVLNPPTRDYLLGVADFWEGAIPLAGMRLDAANEVDPRFWRSLRTRVKAAHPDTWILGEVWGDGSPWLGGDQWDSVMNYPFRDACVHFFAEGKIRPTEFLNSLMAVYDRYPPQVSRNLMNLLSSHDTPRFLTLCKSDEQLQRLAATVQFTWVGTPSIYYGEEVGMEGGADPDDRRAMRWDLVNAENATLRFYKRLIALRNESPALQSSDTRILLTDDKTDTLAYARLSGKDAVLVALNRSSESRPVTIPLPPALRRAGKGNAWTDAFSGKRYLIAPGQTGLTLPLGPHSALVLRLVSHL